MKRIHIYYIVIWLFIYLVSPHLSAAEEGGAAGEISLIKECLYKGDKPCIQKGIERLLQYKDNKGTDNIFYISNILASIAKKEGWKRKNINLNVVAVFEGAKAVSPELYKPYMQLGGYYLKRYYFKEALSNLKKGGLLYIKWNRDTALFLICSIILSSITFSCGFIVIILFLTYRKNIVYEINNFLHISLASYLLLILALPVTTGIIPFIMALPVFFWGYIKRSEKIIVSLLYITMALSPIFIKGISKRFVYANSQVYRTIFDMQHNTWGEKGVNILQAIDDEYPDNWAINFAIGTVYKKKGDFISAQKVLNKVLNSNKDDAEVFVNIGNVMFHQKDFDNAFKYYNKALELNSSLFEAHFNIGQVLGEMGKIEESSKGFSEAINIAPERAKYYMNIENPGINQKTLDSPLPGDALTEINPILKKDITTIYDSIWGWIFGILTEKIFYAYIAVSIFLLAIYHRYMSAKCGYSRLCNICGVLFLSSDGEDVCNDCIKLNKKDGKIDIAKKLEIENRIKRYNSITNISSVFCNLLLPGAGLSIRCYMISGVIHLFITFAFLSSALLAIYIYKISFMAVAVCIAVYYLLTNITFMITGIKWR